ncbi:hypothetical protein GWI33_003562, partial [Rhynchophorus ferrugineus]
VAIARVRIEERGALSVETSLNVVFPTRRVLTFTYFLPGVQSTRPVDAFLRGTRRHRLSKDDVAVDSEGPGLERPSIRATEDAGCGK